MLAFEGLLFFLHPNEKKSNAPPRAAQTNNAKFNAQRNVQFSKHNTMSMTSHNGELCCDRN
jgi:hypothetical protein